ncbi:MAG TPA: tetratricopeptide repeat protein [Candidatus Saccharimonadales bacterium]|nr:tetratricopeptide repeat protein [Candidatus Saccharimonadales bacterium]
MSTDFDRLRELFLDAVEHYAPESWESFLGEACGGDAELRGQLRELLQAHLEGESRLGSESPDGRRPDVPEPDEGWRGTLIGPYKLLEVIGEGGMGTVFMAEQTQPIHRQVALKIIRPGMDSRQVLARFEAERQALALMDHPNIARVLDAGATEAGRPYFVMELIKGVPITRFCDERHLSPSERLELCLPVCRAVQHAHQKGILHRDLKPSNVLVALYDGNPVPKVIDFGVAKAIREPLTDRTLATGFGAIIGTLEYMSPEQAELNQLDVDTRSDIYGLGVLLYELLTGTTPILQEQIRRAASLEVLRWIREEEPPTPSTRLRASGEIRTIAAARGLDPARLSGLMRGEIDWIVMKCLEKDRDRRYESADALAGDIRRYLVGEPVEACPPSPYYRLRKLARKHRRLVLTAAAIIAILIVGILATTWEAIRATRAEALAKEQADIAQQINRFLQDDLLASANPMNSSDRDLKLRVVLDRASEKVETSFKDRPIVEAGLQNTLGLSFMSLGEYPSAERHLRRAFDLYQNIRGPRHQDTNAARNNLALLLNREGHLDEARKLHEENLAILRDTVGPENVETLKSAGGLSVVLLAQAHYGDAQKLLEETLPVARRVLGDEDGMTLSFQANLAIAQMNLGNLEEARKIDESILAIDRKKFGDESPPTLKSANNLASVLRQQGHLQEALELYRETLKAKQHALGPEHPSTLVSMYNIGGLYRAQGKLDEAIRTFEEVLPIQRRVLGPEHTDTLRSMIALCGALHQKGRLEEAASMCEEALAIQRRALGPEHPDTLRSMFALGDVYLDEGRATEARNLYDKALAARRKILDPAHPETLSIVKNLAWLYATSQTLPFRDPGRAEALAREALARTPDDGGVWNTLGVAQYRAGRWEDSIESLRKSMELRHGGDSNDYFFLAVDSFELGRLEEARTWRRKAVEWMDRNSPDNPDLKRFRAEADDVMGPDPG